MEKNRAVAMEFALTLRRIQELEYGGLSEEARNRVNELIEEYDPINNKALKPNHIIIESQNDLRPINTRDKRLPIPGTIITKQYKGNTIQVKVLEKGFEIHLGHNTLGHSLILFLKDIKSQRLCNA